MVQFLWVHDSALQSQYALPPRLTSERTLLWPPGCGATRRPEGPLMKVEGAVLTGDALLPTLWLLTDLGAACAYRVGDLEASRNLSSGLGSRLLHWRCWGLGSLSPGAW